MDYILASYLAWQGRPVTRPGWPEGTYAVLKGATPHIFVKGSTPTVWHSTKEDRRATDFQEIHTGLCRSTAESVVGATGDPIEVDEIEDPEA